MSPDGRLVACEYGEAKPDSQIKLAVIPAEGGPPVRLVEAPAAVKSVVFRWSPDGRRIVYIDSRDRVSNLWEQPLDGGQPTQLTDFKTDQVFPVRLVTRRQAPRPRARARRLRRGLDQRLSRPLARRQGVPRARTGARANPRTTARPRPSGACPEPCERGRPRPPQPEKEDT